MSNLDALRAIPDPVQRVTAAHAALDEVAAERAAVAGVIRETVREMRETMSLAQVAAALGVTRSRVQQLEKVSTDQEASR